MDRLAVAHRPVGAIDRDEVHERLDVEIKPIADQIHPPVMRQRDAEELSRSAVGVLGAFQDFVRRPVGQGDAVDVAAQAKHVQHRCAGVADEAHRRVGHGRDLADGKTLRRRRQRRVAVGGDELIERREDLRRMLYGRAFAPAPEASPEALLFQQDLIVQTDGR